MTKTSRAPGSGTQSIERTVSLLRELATMGIHGARLVDLASRVNLEYPTAHRILRCLVEHKLVEKHAETRRYALGPLVFELGLAAIPRTNLREICEPMMRCLAEQTGDTVFLNVRSGLDAVCIDRREGSFPIKTLVFEVGSRRPLGVGAGGAALLMMLPWNEIEEIVTANAPRMDAYGKLSSQRVIETLKQARKLGYLVTNNVVVKDVSSVALPFAGHGSLPWAAVTVATVSSRLPVSRQREVAGLMRSEIQKTERFLKESNDQVKHVA
ncbi:MAG: IclR family transcriptional regulator [Betaproteobacteria bacterium]|nr:IclR family transcriptional regulator [Betaproteobacteria bacterium]